MLSLLWRICTFSAGPQDLPGSPVLTRNLVLSAAAAGGLFAWLMEVGHPLPRLALSVAMMLAIPHVLLGLRRRRERYAQTLAALAGTDALFTVAFLPLAWVVHSQLPVEPDAVLDPGQVALAWAMLAAFGWKLVITGHILRHALEIPNALGVLLALSWFGIEFMLDHALFGMA